MAQPFTQITLLGNDGSEIAISGALVGPQGIQGIQGIQGEVGPVGPTNSLSIGTVANGAAGATITGTPPNQVLNLTLPSGVAATTSVPGIIQLANDLAGTSTAPQVVSTHLTNPLPLAQGGTAGATVAASRNNLGIADIPSSTVTGALTTTSVTATLATGDGAQFPAAGIGVGSNTLGSGLRFDGNDYVNIGHHSSIMRGAASEPVSVHVRFKLAANYDATQVRYLMIGVSRYYISIGTDLKIQGAVWGVGNPKSQAALSLDTWYDVGLTWDGSVVRLQLDRVFQNQTTGGTSSASGSADIYIGKRNGLSNSEFMGDVALMRIWNVGLTDAQMAQSHVGYGYSTTGLVYNAEFKQDAGLTLTDSVGNSPGAITGATWINYATSKFNGWLYDASAYAHPALDPNSDKVTVVKRTSDSLVISSPAHAHPAGTRFMYDLESTILELPYRLPVAQGGTGAFTAAGARTNINAQRKTSITVGYTDADYIVDSTSPINVQVSAAVDQALVTGQVVEILSGEFEWFAQVTKDASGVRIKGQGQGKTIIKRSSTGMNNSNTMLYIGNSPGPDVRSNIYMEGITWDNNNTGSGFGVGISWCKNVYVRDCAFINPSANYKAVLLLGKFSGGDNPDNWEARDIVVDGCYFDFNGVSTGWEGIGLIFGRNIIMNNCTFRNKKGAAGLLCYNSEQLTVSNCYFWKYSTSIGGRGTTILSTNKYEDTSVLLWEAHNTLITGNTFQATDDAATLGYSVGINMQGGYMSAGGGETPWYITPPYTFTLENVVITNNEFIRGNAAAASATVIPDEDQTVLSVNDLIFSGNKVYKSSREGINLAANYLTVTDNHFIDNNQLTGSSSATHARLSAKVLILEGNTFVTNDGKINDDVRIDNVSYAAQLGSAMTAKIHNNSMSGTINPIQFYTGSGYQTTPTAGVTLEATNNTGMNPNTYNTVTSATGTVTTDRKLYRTHDLTLTGPTTLVVPSAKVIGDEIVHILRQDATGGRTVTLPANYKLAQGQTIEFSTAANAVDMIFARFDGTNWRETGRALSYKTRLDQLAAPTASVSMGSQKITNVLDPTSAQDAATKNYVDSMAQGLDIKASVRVATTAAGTLASSFENGDTVDGVVLATGDRILIKDQASGSENGIYTVNATGAPTRATDADSSADVTSGLFTFVAEGTTNADSGWTLTTNDPIVLGTTALSFTQFSGAGQVTAGAGLTKTGNTINAIAGSSKIVVAADSIDVDQTQLDRNLLSGGALSIANGGTGATSAAAAITALGAVDLTSTQTIGGSKTFSTDVTLTTGSVRVDNGRGLYIKDNGGTYRLAFYQDSANNFQVLNGAASGTVYFGNANPSNTGGGIIGQLAGANSFIFNTTGVSILTGSSPSAVLDLLGATTAKASLRVRSGVAPSSPNDGDIWQDGTHLYSRTNAATRQVVLDTDTQTLTNKTLTSPVINTPTGIAKGDVGLGNVDNTSDATKNSATATLTNKTLTSPVINTPTGIVKGDVGLGNVDNTSDATKNSASATLTNKTLTSPVINTPTGIVKGDVGLGNVDNTSDATKNSATATLTNKRITRRVVALTDGANIAANSDNIDIGTVTLAGASRTFDNPTGTPTDGQLLQYRIRQDATGSRGTTLAFGTAFRFGADIPTILLSTGANVTDYLLFQYNSTDSKWDCTAFSKGY